MTAAAACVAGMRCVLVLTTTAEPAGNRRQPAARPAVRREIRLVPVDRSDVGGRAGRGGRRRRRCRRNARPAASPYVIPVGGSSGVGVLRLRRRQRRNWSSNCQNAGISAVASVLRERIARHTGRSDARRQAYATHRIASTASPSAPVNRKRSSVPSGSPTRRRARLGLPERLDLERSGHRSGITSATATAFRPPAASRRSSYWRRPKRSCSIPCYTSKAMAALIDHVRAASCRRTRPSCSCTPAACRRCSRRNRRSYCCCAVDNGGSGSSQAFGTPTLSASVASLRQRRSSSAIAPCFCATSRAAASRSPGDRLRRWRSR